MPLYAALIYDGAENQDAEPSPEEWASVMADYNEFGEAAGAAGVLRGGEALQPTSPPLSFRIVRWTPFMALSARSWGM